MSEVIYFLLTFIITYFISYIVVIRKEMKKQNKSKKKKKNKRKKENNKDKIPVEINYLIKRYNLDMDKINYTKLLYVSYLVASLDMAITMVTISQIKNIYLQIIVAFFVMIPLILVTFNSIGNYYIKRGMIKNEHERNRK